MKAISKLMFSCFAATALVLVSGAGFVIPHARQINVAPMQSAIQHSQTSATATQSGTLSKVSASERSQALNVSGEFAGRNVSSVPSASASTAPSSSGTPGPGAGVSPFSQSQFIQLGSPSFSGNVTHDFPMQFIASYNNSTHEQILISADQNYIYIGFNGPMSGQSLFVVFANDTSSGIGTTNFTNMHNSTSLKKMWDANFNSTLPINSFFFANLTGNVSTSNATIATVVSPVTLSNTRAAARNHTLSAGEVLMNSTENSTEFYIPWSYLYSNGVSGYRNLSVMAFTSFKGNVVTSLPSRQPGHKGLYYFADNFINYTSVFSYSASGPFTLNAVYQEFVSHTTTSGVGTILYFPVTVHYSSITARFQDIYISNVFDTSYGITVGGVEIMAGNTNETINTYTEVNVTGYSSLFSGVQTVSVSSAQFNPGYASLLSAIFTFVPTNGPPAGFQHVMSVLSGSSLPPFGLTGRQPYREGGNILVPFNYTASVNETFPANISRIELNLFMLQNQNDEFWYSNTPPFREFFVEVNGTKVATVQPYPNVQTGGIDFMLWQPINAIGANVNPPYAVNLTAFSYLFSGKTVVNLTVVNDENVWIRVGLNFLFDVSTSHPAPTKVKYAFAENNHYSQTPGLIYSKNATGYIKSDTLWLNDSNYHNTSLSGQSSYTSGGNRTNMSVSYNSSFFSGSVQFNPELYYATVVSSTYIIFPFKQDSSTYQQQSYLTRETITNSSTGHTLYSRSMSTQLAYSISFMYGFNLVFYDGIPVIYLSLTINQSRQVSVTTSIYNGTGTRTWSNTSITDYKSVTGSGLTVFVLVGPGLAFVLYNFGVTALFHSRGYVESTGNVVVASAHYSVYMQAVNSGVQRSGSLIEKVLQTGSALPAQSPRPAGGDSNYSSPMKVAAAPVSRSDGLYSGQKNGGM